MERLTQWNGSKYILPQGRTPDGKSYWRIIADKLAMYENAEEVGTGWIDTRDALPLEDGYYLTQTVFGELNGYPYTTEGGWNSRHLADGSVSAGSALYTTYIARWYNAPTPPEVPEEWELAHLEAFRKGVSE